MPDSLAPTRRRSAAAVADGDDAPLPSPATRRSAEGAAATDYGDETLMERAYRTLEEAIVTLDLRPGEVVSEAQLAARYGFGRTPVREALQRLAWERLVRILPRRGIVVAGVDVREQLRLLELRREVERLCARAAARRADAAQRARFRSIAAAMERCAETQDQTAFLRLDREFNLLVLEAARNEFAAATMVLVHGLSRRFWFIHGRDSADLPRVAEEHAALARAIAEGDAEAAATASDRLLDDIERITRATVGPDA
jgi:DNA-binding GntR family transcriptional regulator